MATWPDMHFGPINLLNAPKMVEYDRRLAEQAGEAKQDLRTARAQRHPPLRSAANAAWLSPQDEPANQE